MTWVPLEVNVPTADTLLTKESMSRILQAEQIELINLKSGWSHFTWNQKRININSHARRYCQAKGHMRRGDNKRVREDYIWLGVHSINENLFADSNISCGKFKELSDGSAGKIYTTKPITESHFHTLITELKK